MEREQTTIRLPVELKEQLQREAERTKKSYNDYIGMILRKWLKEHQFE